MPKDKRGLDSARSETGPAATRPAPATEPYWRAFPQLEKLLELEHPPLLDRIKTTCQQLDGILKSGSPQEKARAQDAITAYARALELYRDLANRRDHALAETSNPARLRTISKSEEST